MDNEIDIKLDDLKYFMQLIKWKKEKPEEYKHFWIDLKDIMKDMMKTAKELSDEMEKMEG